MTTLTVGFAMAELFLEEAQKRKNIERPTVLGNEWISVADRLPHDGQQVLIHAEKIGTNSATYHEPCFGDNEKWLGWFSDEMPEPNVTHWQPLPLPPLKNDNHE